MYRLQNCKVRVLFWKFEYYFYNELFILWIFSFRHWLATSFVIWYGVPYMSYDIFAMYLSHFYRFRVKGHEDYKGHSLRTFNSFVRKEFLLVLHHIALLTILLPITLVRDGLKAGCSLTACVCVRVCVGLMACEMGLCIGKNLVAVLIIIQA